MNHERDLMLEIEEEAFKHYTPHRSSLMDDEKKKKKDRVSKINNNFVMKNYRDEFIYEG